MPASTVYVNGRVTGVPGAYSKVDASALERRGLGASGVVAVVGTVEGGAPASSLAGPEDLPRFTSAPALRRAYVGGDCLKAGRLAFAPSNDEAITAGAQEVIVVKVNQAVQGSLSLANPDGDAIDITARDYGVHTNAITVAVADGTTSGKRVTITDGTIVETGDNLADNAAIITWINANSQLVSAAASTGATATAVDNASAANLTSGAEGTASQANWQAGLDMLRQVRVNSVVVLTPDAAVHAALDAHVDFMAGAGKKECDGFVGILGADETGLATKSEIKSQIAALNNRNIRAVAEQIDVFDENGEIETLDPHFYAAILAGMQAGSPVGTPLTRKRPAVLRVRRDSSWNPVDDGNEMIAAGLVFSETVDGVGIRIVRNVTTAIQSNNLAFTDAHVNEAVNYAVYELRTAWESAVGRKGFQGTANALKAIGLGKLAQLLDEQIIVGYQPPLVTIDGDTARIDVEISPVIGINFVLPTIFLNTQTITA